MKGSGGRGQVRANVCESSPRDGVHHPLHARGVRTVLPLVLCPTLVLSRRDYGSNGEIVDYLVARIPMATPLNLPGTNSSSRRCATERPVLEHPRRSVILGHTPMRA